MLMRELRATKMVATLKVMGIKAAEAITVEDACRLWSRAQRAAFSTGEPMHPAQLASYSTRRRRAKITHPGKRAR